MCRKILLSQTIDQKQAATFEGLLKIKESGNSTYEIFLRGGGRKGEIVFTK